VETLRIGTFNLLHGIPIAAAFGGGRGGAPTAPPAPDLGLLRAAAVELDADVLGLQEVDRAQPRSDGANQTAEIADATGAKYWRFVPAVHGTPGDERDWWPATADDGEDTDGPTYGIGLVSRLPVLDWQVHRFAAAPFSIPLVVPGVSRPRVIKVPDEPRVALAAVVEGPHGPFTFITTHLSFVPGYNVRQLRALARWAGSLPRPVILAGDLNLPGRIPRLASGWESLAAVATYPSPRPRVQLDHLLCLGHAAVGVVRFDVHTLPVSDHCALTAELTLGRPSPSS